MIKITCISTEKSFYRCEIREGMVRYPETRCNLHEVVDGEGIEEAEKDARYDG